MMGRLTAGVQRVSEETMAAIGFILQGVSTVALYFAPDPVTLGILSLLFGIGYGTYIPEFALLVRKHYGVEHYGSIFGTLLTSFGIGAFIGPVFEGVSVSSSTGYLPGFLLSAVVSLTVGAHIFTTSRTGKATSSQSRARFGSWTFHTACLNKNQVSRTPWSSTFPRVESRGRLSPSTKTQPS